MLRLRTIMTLAAALLLIAGTSYSAAGSGRWGGGGSGGLTPLSAEEIAGLVYMWEEEKLARDSYLLLDEEWDLMIFASISVSEQRHMNAVKLLIDKYALEDQIDENLPVGSFVDPILQTLFNDLMDWGMESMMDSLYVGGAVEETDILDLEKMINGTDSDHTDIIATYENLLCGSRNHLRAFVRQIEMNGEAYVPFLMSEEQVAEIVTSPMQQRCGAGNRRVKGRR